MKKDLEHLPDLPMPQPANLSGLRGAPGNRVPLAAIAANGPDAILPSSLDLTSEDAADARKTPAAQRAGAAAVWNSILKAERMALEVDPVVDAWERVPEITARMRKQGSPIGLGQLRGGGTRKDQVLRPVYAGPAGTDSFWELMKAVGDTLSQAAYEWEDERIARQHSLQPNELDAADRAYQRLADMMSYGNRHHLFENGTPGSVIATGFGTAVLAMMGVVEVIPRVYQAQFGTEISRDELVLTAERSLPLLMHLAAGHIDRTVPLLAALQDNEGVPAWKRGNSKLNASYFMLAGDEGKFSLQLTDRAFRELKMEDDTPIAEAPLEGPTAGCPAIPAQVIPKMWQFVRGIAEQTYFPAFA